MNDCCDICGAAGIVELLATCCKCLTSREHLYCMRVRLSEHPDQWYCQDCDPEKDATPPTCDTREDLTTSSTFKTPSKVNNGGLKKWERRVRTGRTQYIPVAEALKLPSGSKKPDQVFHSTFRSSLALPKRTGNLRSPVKNVSSSRLVSDLKQAADTSAQTRVGRTPKKAFLTPSPSMGDGSKKQSGKVTSLVKNMPSSQLVNDRKHTADTRVPSRVEMTPTKSFLTRSPSSGYGLKIKSDNYVFQSPKEKQPIDCLADVGRSKSAEAKVEQAMKKASQIPNRSTDSAPRVEVALSPPSPSTIRASRIISGISEARAPKEKQVKRLHPEARAPKEKQIERLHPRNRLVDVADARTTETNVEPVMKKDPLRPSTSTIGAPRGDVFPNVHHKSSEAEKDNLENVQPNAEIYRGPAQDASWKGCFKMTSDECNIGLCSGIQGCPPSVVLKKVYEMSKGMPETLKLELIARADPWKTIFQDRCPDFDDVGLFFFPSENKRCDNYFTWLEFIGKKDLVMRMCMHGVELLVFTSAHLHRNCQTWRGVHFFWGVFRVVEVGRSLASDGNILRPCSPNEAGNCCSEGDDSQVVDMVIDMEAGKAVVGMVDIVMKINSGGERSEAVGEPFITTITDVSARLGLLKSKEEQRDAPPLGMEKKMYEQRASGPLLQAKNPRLGSPNNIIRWPEEKASPHIDTRAIAMSSKQENFDIPPGFKEPQSLGTAVASNIPSGPHIDARAIAMPSKPENIDIPPGFKEPQTLRTVASNIPPGPHINARAIAMPSKPENIDIPPGFKKKHTPGLKELQTLKTISPGSEKMHTPRTSHETSKYKISSTSPSSASTYNFSSHPTDRAQAMVSGKEGGLSPLDVKIKSEVP